ncbi:MAG: hypothetical protein AB7I48_26935 [Planctomycetaceae bacterium]
MQIEIPDDLKIREQAVAAGFASVEDYVTTLLDRDAERVAIRAGLDAMTAGRTRPFEEFDREFREQNHLDAPQ